MESLGYLDALKKEYDDPVAYFTDKAADMTNASTFSLKIKQSKTRVLKKIFFNQSYFIFTWQ